MQYLCYIPLTSPRLNSNIVLSNVNMKRQTKPTVPKLIKVTNKCKYVQSEVWEPYVPANITILGMQSAGCFTSELVRSFIPISYEKAQRKEENKDINVQMFSPQTM